MMLFVIHAKPRGSMVNVILQHGSRIIGRMEMEPTEWKGFRRLLGSGVSGATSDGVTARLIDEMMD